MKKFFSPEPSIITTGGGGPGLFHDTIRNMKKAVSNGSDVIRTNAAMTKDNRIILFSNAVFQNRRIAEAGIADHTLEELKALYLNGIDTDSGDNKDDLKGIFPEIEESLAELNQQRFNFHLPYKNPSAIGKFCDIISNSRAKDRVLVSTLSGRDLKKIRELLPGIPTAFSFGGILGLYLLHRSGLLYFKKNFVDDALITHEMIGGSFICNPQLIKEAREKGVRVYVLNIMKEDEVKRLNEAGVNGFVTNYASLVKRSLASSEK